LHAHPTFLDDDIAAEFVEVRHALHRHPELAFKEHRTSSMVARLLTSYGLEVSSLAGTGVVGTLRGGGSTASLGLRADMDALPITEKSGVGHASVTDGVMHACGHDGHTTMLLAAAKSLAHAPRPPGTVNFIFQPAEEVGVDSGAQKMIAEGLFERFPCDAVFAMHVHPGVEAGHFITRPGPFMAAGDRVFIRVLGRGGHAARPHLTVDASLVASHIVAALQSVVSRNVRPGTAAVISVGRLLAGTVFNVIPDSAEIELSVRSFDEETRSLLRERIGKIASSQAESFGATVEVNYQLGYPVLVNDLNMTNIAVLAATDAVGHAHVDGSADLIMGSEDFSLMLNERPGCLIRIGNGLNGRPLHHPGFDFADENIPVGAAFWISLVNRFFNSAPPAPKGPPCHAS
jgi:hippurate hydrolase